MLHYENPSIQSQLRDYKPNSQFKPHKLATYVLALFPGLTYVPTLFIPKCFRATSLANQPLMKNDVESFWITYQFKLMLLSSEEAWIHHCCHHRKKVIIMFDIRIVTISQNLDVPIHQSGRGEVKYF